MIGFLGADTDRCDLRQMRRVAALLDRDPDSIVEGAPLPAGWHFALFTTLDQQSTLRADGHAPASAAGLAKLAGQEVMLAGRRTRYDAPIEIGSAMLRRSEVLNITSKEGRSGLLTFVTLRHSISTEGSDEPAIIEEEDFVYRAPSPPEPRPMTLGEEVDANEQHGLFRPDAAMLFRYSALSYNAHRIHYDRDYATKVAGYPDLVVNGGLIAVTLLDLFARQVGRHPRSTTTKSIRPLFCERTAALSIAEDEKGWTMVACNDASAPAMRMTIR